MTRDEISKLEIKNYVVVKEFVSKHAGVVAKDTLLKGPVAGITTDKVDAEIYLLTPPKGKVPTGYQDGSWPITKEEINKFCITYTKLTKGDRPTFDNFIDGANKVDAAQAAEFTNPIKYNTSEHDDNETATDCPFNSKMRVASRACQACKHHRKLDSINKIVTCAASGGKVEPPTMAELASFMKKPCSCPSCTARRAKGEETESFAEPKSSLSVLSGLLGAIMPQEEMEKMILEPAKSSLIDMVKTSIDEMSNVLPDLEDRKAFKKTTLAAVIDSLTETLGALELETDINTKSEEK